MSNVSIDEIPEVLKEALESGDPKRVAAARRLRAWAVAERNLDTARDALAVAERLHANTVTDLRNAISGAEAYAAPRVKDAREAIEKATAPVIAAQAALVEAEARHQVEIEKLTEAVVRAESEAALAQLKA